MTDARTSIFRIDVVPSVTEGMYFATLVETYVAGVDISCQSGIGPTPRRAAILAVSRTLREGGWTEAEQVAIRASASNGAISEIDRDVLAARGAAEATAYEENGDRLLARIIFGG